MATILIELPYAMSARNFLRSGVIEHLAARHQVVVLTPLSSDPQFQQEFGGNTYKIEPLVYYDKTEARGWFQQVWDRVVVSPTEIRELAHRQQIVTHFLKFARLQREEPWLALSQELIWRLLKTLPGLLRVCQEFNWRLQDHPYYTALFERYQPDLVVFTHTFEWRSQSLLAAVRKYQIPTVAMVHSWDNLSSKGVIRHPFQQLLVWNEVNRQEALQFYPQFFQPGQVTIVGIPQFSHYWNLRAQTSGRTEFLQSLGLDPERKLISFFLGNRLRYPDQDYVIATLLEHLEELPEPSQLLVRLHPGWDSQELNALKQQFAHPQVHFNVPEISDAATPYQQGWTANQQRLSLVTDLIRHSQVIINTSSTTTLEAALLDVPIIAIAFDRNPLPEALSCRRFLTETHYQPVLSSGATKTAFSPEELIRYVADYLREPSLDREGRDKLVATLCGPPDEKTSERILAAIELTLLQLNQNMDRIKC